MRRLGKVYLWLAVATLVLLAVVQFAASPLATRVANRRLAELPQFTGTVGRVSLQLWRGTVTVEDLALTDRAHPGDGPVVTVPRATLSFAWAPLFRGRIGGDAVVEEAEIVMVKWSEEADDEQEKAKKLSKPIVRAWQKVLAQEFPLELRKLEIRDSKLRFEDRTDPQVVGMEIDRIHLVVTGFANRKDGDETLPAELRLTARIAGSGHLSVGAQADPTDPQPRFEATLEVKGLSLPAMHDFLVHYALVDVKSGEFELYSEITAEGGAYRGYTKPFFKDLEFDAVPDPEKNLLQRAATRIAAAAEDLLENEQGDVATKAPFEGNFEDNDIDVWTTLENLLRNAFVQALREGLEGQAGITGGSR